MIPEEIINRMAEYPIQSSIIIGICLVFSIFGVIFVIKDLCQKKK